jgi:hypothetical protein
LSFGYCGDGTGADEVLRGNYQYTGSDQMVRLLLQHLKQTDEIRQIPNCPTITLEEYVSKLRVWRESTATSPSGLHLGHYKAMIARHAYSHVTDTDTEELRLCKAELDFKQSEILEVHLALLNYAMERGYSYRRWHTVANTILFKDQDNIRIHPTRVIHIYEADYNLALGIKWRLAMQSAEKASELHPGQFGSRQH